jgi:hypothetical protein
MQHEQQVRDLVNKELTEPQASVVINLAIKHFKEHE